MSNELRDQDYFRRRAQVERECAMRAVVPAVRRVHLEMADRYAARVASPTAEMRISA